ncbi:MAG: ParA family protein [Pseudomonadota bacterium]
MTRPSVRILAVANQKGGVGKTTTAINVGTALAQAGQKCLLVDLDPQGNASTGLNVPAEERDLTTYDALSGSSDLAPVILESEIPGLSLAPASVDLSGIDVELVDDQHRARRLASLLGAPDVLAAEYDVILIDCPPSLNLLTVNAMVAAHAVLVPLQCEFFALEGLTQLLSTVRQIQQTLNPGLRIDGIVLTMFDRRNRLSAQVAEDVRQNLGDVVYNTMIPRNVRLSEAPSHALPALIYDPHCAGSRAYRELAQEFMGRTRKATAA